MEDLKTLDGLLELKSALEEIAVHFSKSIHPESEAAEAAVQRALDCLPDVFWFSGPKWNKGSAAKLVKSQRTMALYSLDPSDGKLARDNILSYLDYDFFWLCAQELVLSATGIISGPYLTASQAASATLDTRLDFEVKEGPREINC